MKMAQWKAMSLYLNVYFETSIQNLNEQQNKFWD